MARAAKEASDGENTVASFFGTTWEIVLELQE